MELIFYLLLCVLIWFLIKRTVYSIRILEHDYPFLTELKKSKKKNRKKTISQIDEEE